MDSEAVQPKRMRRRTSIMHGNPIVPGSNVDCSGTSMQTTNTELLDSYVKAVENEKKKWADYESELKAEYSQLKRGLPGNAAVIDHTNFMNYLEEDEKNFLSELRDVERESKQFLSDLHLLEKRYKLLVPEMKNVRKHLKHLLVKKREMCIKAQREMVESSI